MGGRIFVLLFIFVMILFYSNASPVAAADPNPDLRINIQVIQKIGGLKSTTSKPSAALISTTAEPDESITEVLTCRGRTRCLTEVCPNPIFTDRHVCLDCDVNRGRLSVQATEFVKNLVPRPTGNHTVFFPRDYSRNDIDYNSIGDDCVIRNTVMAFICVEVPGKWRCHQEGYCTGKSDVNTGVDDPDSLECPCPNPDYQKKHVCDVCEDGASALTFTDDSNRPKTFTGPNNVLDSQQIIAYELSEVEENGRPVKSCKATRRVRVWNVFRNENADWRPWVELGLCGNIQSARFNGHFFYSKKDCYKVHTHMTWSSQCSQIGEDFPASNHEMCMDACTSNDEYIGCTAFDYKIGEKCIMRKCPLPVPPPTTSNGTYNGYYLNRGFKVHIGRRWSNQCEEIATIWAFNHEYCMENCLVRKRYSGCTAFDYNIGKNCTMMKCPVPVPTPTTVDINFDGYYLYTDSP